jgi:hypothetical protein
LRYVTRPTRIPDGLWSNDGQGLPALTMDFSCLHSDIRDEYRIIGLISSSIVHNFTILLDLSSRYNIITLQELSILQLRPPIPYQNRHTEYSVAKEPSIMALLEIFPRESKPEISILAYVKIG